jgi:hypothetical protein
MTLTPERERRLDSMVRAAILVDPPADLQARLSQLVSIESIWPLATRERAVGEHLRPPAPARPGWAVYVGVACILAAYLGVAGWLTWSTVVESLVGLARPEALLLVWQVLPTITALATANVAWIALIPVVWFLWDRDRADAGSDHPTRA